MAAARRQPAPGQAVARSRALADARAAGRPPCAGSPWKDSQRRRGHILRPWQDSVRRSAAPGCPR
eukprot:1746139-Alexandrium_andersonii.AAC.1